MRSAEVVMVTFAETTQVSPMELREPPCLAATLSPGLRRKKMLWQNAVKHIIIQQELSAQVTHHHTTDRKQKRMSTPQTSPLNPP